MVELQGYIDRIVFRNEENGYSVLCMKEGNKEEFLVGVFPDVSEGEYLTARGEMNVHPIYGKQLNQLFADPYLFLKRNKLFF